MSVRARHADEVPALVALGRSAFRNTTAPERWTRYYAENPHLPASRTLVAERDSRLLGTASLLDLRMAVDGRAVPIDGVAAVAVHHTGRRQGVADALMRRSVTEASARRTAFSALYAFRGSFYRRFGYAPVEMGHVLSVRPSDLPDSPERARVRPFVAGDREALERCYRAALAGRTGPLVRSAMWWNHRVLFDEEQDRVVYAGARGRIEGYAIAKLIEPAPLSRRRLRVLELIALHAGALRGLVGWLGALGDEFEALEVSLPADESWAPFLRTPRFRDLRVPTQWEAAGAIGWGLMARVTDLERALATRVSRGVRARFVLELRDPVDGALPAESTVRLDGSGATLAKSRDSGARVRTDVGVFTQVLLGAVRASHARDFGALETDAETAARLDDAWFGPAPFVGALNEF